MLGKIASRLHSQYSCKMPEFYYIDPCNICNLKCPFCPNQNAEQHPKKGQMALADFEIIVRNIANYAKKISLFNWGEPFINQNLVEMIKFASDLSIKVTTCSNLNARVFDEDYAERLVMSGLHELFVALDGSNQQSYEKYRVGGKLDIAMHNINLLQKAKAKYRSKSPTIIWQYLINIYNENEIATTIAMAKRLGIKLEFKLMSVPENSEWISSYHDNTFKVRGLQFATAVLFNRWGELLNWFKNSIKTRIFLSKSLPGICLQIFDTMIINWDGNALPCCAVYNDKMVMGNLIRERIEDVWNNSNYLKCREYVFNYDRGVACNSFCESGLCSVRPRSQDKG